MVFFLLILLLIIFSGMRFSGSGQFNTSYLDKKSTTAINGIFVIMIVFSHYSQYANFAGIYDESYLILREHLNQMVVATFLFYSGYGMMESLHRKGKAYVLGVPGKFLKLLFTFDVAVLLYLILDICLKMEYPLSTILLAFTSWVAIGNSNWYITAILLLYVFFFISFALECSEKTKGKVNGAGRYGEIACLFVLTIACVYFQMKIGRPAYCYDTMILFPLGCFYSQSKQYIESMVMKNDFFYFCVLALAVGVYAVSFFHRWSGGIEVFSIWSIAFIALVLLITMKVRIYNELLDWFGTHIFSIYILQRIPMTLLMHFGCIESHRYLSLIIVFTVTIPLALAFEKVTDTIIAKVTSR